MVKLQNKHIYKQFIKCKLGLSLAIIIFNFSQSILHLKLAKHQSGLPTLSWLPDSSFHFSEMSRKLKNVHSSQKRSSQPKFPHFSIAATASYWLAHIKVLVETGYCTRHSFEFNGSSSKITRSKWKFSQ